MVVVVQLVGHFSVRRFEWFMALAFVVLGLALAAPGDTFSNSSSYALLARLLPEDTWAEILIWTGAVRCAVLFFNGVVMRRAAEVRAAFGVWSFSVTILMGLLIDAAASQSSTLANLLFLMAAFELSNIWTASLDAHDRRQERRHAAGLSR